MLLVPRLHLFLDVYGKVKLQQMMDDKVRMLVLSCDLYRKQSSPLIDKSRKLMCRVFYWLEKKQNNSTYEPKKTHDIYNRSHLWSMVQQS